MSRHAAVGMSKERPGGEKGPFQRERKGGEFPTHKKIDLCANLTLKIKAGPLKKRNISCLRLWGVWGRVVLYSVARSGLMEASIIERDGMTYARTRLKEEGPGGVNRNLGGEWKQGDQKEKILSIKRKGRETQAVPRLRGRKGKQWRGVEKGK